MRNSQLVKVKELAGVLSINLNQSFKCLKLPEVTGVMYDLCASVCIDHVCARVYLPALNQACYRQERSLLNSEPDVNLVLILNSVRTYADR